MNSKEENNKFKISKIKSKSKMKRIKKTMRSN